MSDTTETPPPAPRRLSRRWLWLGIGLGIATLLLVIAAASGRWIRTKVLDHVKPEVEKRLGGTLAWSDLDASWLTVTARDLAFTPGESGSPFLRAKEARLALDFLSLFSGRPKIQEMRFLEPALSAGVPDAPTLAEAARFLSRIRGGHGGSGESAGTVRGASIRVNDGRIELGAAGGVRLELQGLSVDLSPSGRITLGTGPIRATAQGGCEVFSAAGFDAEGEIPAPMTLRARLREPRSLPCGAATPPVSRRQALTALVTSLRQAAVAAGPSQDDEAGTQPVQGSAQLAIEVENGTLAIETAPDATLRLTEIAGRVSRSAGAKAPLAGSLTARMEGADEDVDIDFLLDAATGKGEGGIKIAYGKAEWLQPILARYPWIHDLAAAKAALTLRYSWPEAADRVDILLSLNLEGISLASDWLAGVPIPMPPLKIESDAYLLPGESKLQISRLKIFLKNIPMDMVGHVVKPKDDLPERLAFDLTWSMPPVGCKALLETLPQAFVPHVGGMKVEGTVGASVRLAVDPARPEATVLDGSLDNRCVVLDEGRFPKSGYFKGPFEHTAQGANGLPLKFMTGPGSDEWTPLAAVSPYFLWSLFVTEDGKFARHSGMTLPEMRRAIEMNLRESKWTHGASTITMQTAKNLFLDREKTLSRKFEELVLTWWLETHFSKEEILELYVNIIEFGPDLYGIRNAAMAYFGRPPSDLDLVESVFLAKLLPDPKDRWVSYKKGEASERWMSVLHGAMAVLYKRGYITKEELDAGLQGKLDFHKEGEPLPAPHELLWSSFSPSRGVFGPEVEPAPDSVLIEE